MELKWDCSVKKVYTSLTSLSFVVFLIPVQFIYIMDIFIYYILYELNLILPET